MPSHLDQCRHGVKFRELEAVAEEDDVYGVPRRAEPYVTGQQLLSQARNRRCLVCHPRPGHVVRCPLIPLKPAVRSRSDDLEHRPGDLKTQSHLGDTRSQGELRGFEPLTSCMPYKPGPSPGGARRGPVCRSPAVTVAGCGLAAAARARPVTEPGTEGERPDTGRVGVLTAGMPVQPVIAKMDVFLPGWALRARCRACLRWKLTPDAALCDATTGGSGSDTRAEPKSTAGDGACHFPLVGRSWPPRPACTVSQHLGR